MRPAAYTSHVWPLASDLDNRSCKNAAAYDFQQMLDTKTRFRCNGRAMTHARMGMGRWTDACCLRLPLRTDPARSTSVSDDRFRPPLGFSALGCTVLMILTTKSEWLRELASFIFVVAIERCSLPAEAGDENQNNRNVIALLPNST